MSITNESLDVEIKALQAKKEKLQAIQEELDENHAHGYVIATCKKCIAVLKEEMNK